MTPWIVLIATATVGVDQGWQPIAGGGYEYIIQIEPETLESIKNGRDLYFQMPLSLNGVRGYRITSGIEPLPHDGEPLPAADARAAENEIPNEPRTGNPRPMPKNIEISKSTAIDEQPAPGAMTPEPGSRPLPTVNQQAGGNQQVSGAGVAPAAAAADVSKSSRGIASSAQPNKAIQDEGSPSDDLPKGFDAAGDTETKPIWMSLNFALMVLFASLGVNLFLGWVTVAQRGRYRSVLARLAAR
jgi:hypothetical protein